MVGVVVVAASIIATRQALDITNGKTVGTIVVAIIALLIVLAIVGIILGTIFGLGMLFGAALR